MLGNWSFGDYFKKEAIAWAWELLTEVWKLDKSRLHATVFEGSPDEDVPRDDEAYNFWKSETDIDPSQIHWGNKKDNFWEMGDTGPCGPCSEIHYDRTPEKSGGKLVNAGSPLVIEIWNLVFIQFNRAADKKLTALPAKHVDTGMGFERITAILQGKESNYDTDVFTPIFAAIQKITNAPKYTAKLDDLKDTAYRVVADHVRTLTFALTDGAKIGTNERDYVLRRVLRRAERFGRQYLGTIQPFLCEIIPTVVEVMGNAFPELKRNPKPVIGMVRVEEEGFIRTLDRGIKLFQEAAERARNTGSNVISGKDAFKLHDTYGFPIDLTEQMAVESGLVVDRQGYEQEMEDVQGRQDGAPKKPVITAITGELPKTDDSPKYGRLPLACKATLLGWVKDNAVVRSGRLDKGGDSALVLDRTMFYAEQGGQVGDTGGITTPTGAFHVQDTQKLGDSVLHIGKVVEGHLESGQSATLVVRDRSDTMRNHTATHLLNWALRKVLGDHVEQKGSLVDAEKTRFDFTHDKPLSAKEIAEVEQLVNERIYFAWPVTALTVPLAEARKIEGVRAVFGEKYPDPVRVLLIGVQKLEDVDEGVSVEFCGGTHVPHTGQIGFFRIISQEGVAKGVRRVTAVTGRGAAQTVQVLSAVVDELTGRFNCKPEELPARVAALQDEVKKLQQQLKKSAAVDLQSSADKLLASATDLNGAKLIIGEMPSGPDEAIRQQVDRLRQKAGSAVVVLGWTTDEGKVQLLAAVTGDLIKKGLHAGKLIGQVAKVVGGGGGGKPDMAQAGGKDPAKLGEALELARKLVREQLKV
jgi:alanyl-tRNA synthetase